MSDQAEITSDNETALDLKAAENLSKKSSIYKGVFKCGRKFKAQIQTNCVQNYLGLYDTEIEAAKAYDKQARIVLGSRARTNFDYQDGSPSKSKGKVNDMSTEPTRLKRGYSGTKVLRTVEPRLGKGDEAEISHSTPFITSVQNPYFENDQRRALPSASLSHMVGFHGYGGPPSGAGHHHPLHPLHQQGPSKYGYGGGGGGGPCEYEYEYEYAATTAPSHSTAPSTFNPHFNPHDPHGAYFYHLHRHHHHDTPAGRNPPVPYSVGSYAPYASYASYALYDPHAQPPGVDPTRHNTYDVHYQRLFGYGQFAAADPVSFHGSVAGAIPGAPLVPEERGCSSEESGLKSVSSSRKSVSSASSAGSSEQNSQPDRVGSTLAPPPTDVDAVIPSGLSPTTHSWQNWLYYWAGALHFDPDRAVHVWKGFWARRDSHAGKPSADELSRSFNQFEYSLCGEATASTDDTLLPQFGSMHGFYCLNSDGTGGSALHTYQYTDIAFQVEFDESLPALGDGVSDLVAVYGHGDCEFGEFVVTGSYSPTSRSLEMVRQYIANTDMRSRMPLAQLKVLLRMQR